LKASVYTRWKSPASVTFQAVVDADPVIAPFSLGLRGSAGPIPLTLCDDQLRSDRQGRP
jgi:hypothetical protein